ncbi:hypothetical protein LCGC14_1504700 [marine sediment metagenome]|uniref:Uncharacterized protein n=1 Tax=marine sediment metagenome TaxID=412755 RepID=A0A0F9J3H8_9ZZZZ
MSDSAAVVIRQQIEHQKYLLQEARERRRRIFDEIDDGIAALNGLCLALERLVTVGDER